MRTQRLVKMPTLPHIRAELQHWMREAIRLSPGDETALLEAFDAVFNRHEQLWLESKHDAIEALSAGYAERLARITSELQAKDATTSQISSYFEQLVAELTDKSNRDRRPS